MTLISCLAFTLTVLFTSADAIIVAFCSNEFILYLILTFDTTIPTCTISPVPGTGILSNLSTLFNLTSLEASFESIVSSSIRSSEENVSLPLLAGAFLDDIVSSVMVYSTPSAGMKASASARTSPCASTSVIPSSDCSAVTVIPSLIFFTLLAV